MRNAVSEGGFKGFSFNDNVKFELLQFADDIVIVCDADPVNLWCIKDVLRGFERVSGL